MEYVLWHNYITSKRTWLSLTWMSKLEILDVGYCTDVKPKSKAIDNLVMKKERKEMIKALVVCSSAPLGF